MNEKILVVDDEKEIADLVEVYLKNENYTVYKYYSAKEVLDNIDNLDVDLAILDVMMPEIDGFMLCNKIRKKYTFPIIFATAKVEEIDKINILQATFLAMRRAVDGLSVKPDIALIDGNKKPGLDIEQWDIVKGDATSANIAAASIIAKVSRDRYMFKLAEKYPQYQFEKHKGYGTKLHNELILKYGASPVHRKTFLRKLYAKNGGEQL